MRDLFLRFADEADWTALALERDPGLLEIDVIGHPQREAEPAEYDAAGGMTKAAVFETLAIWRVNVRCMDDRELPELEPYRVYPASPARVWA